MPSIKAFRKIPGVRRIYRLFLLLRYHFSQKRTFDKTIFERVDGRPLIILPQVMNPKIFRTGEFFARVLSPNLISEKMHVLDMGTGSGVAAIVAAQWAASVTAVDINSTAVRCARMNVILNEFEDKITVLEGDLFEPVKNKRFDVIQFNPPYLYGTPKNDFERGFFDTDTIKRFSREVRPFLNPSGKLLLMLSSLADLPQIHKQFAAVNLPLKLEKEKHFINETLLFFSAKK